MSQDIQELVKEYKYGFHDSEEGYVFKGRKGLDEEVVAEISAIKGEPDWMRKTRLHALSVFRKKPLPMWGANLTDLDFDDIHYYVRPTEGQGRSWEEVPEYIKDTFERLGIPEAERKFLAGVSAQYESEVVYQSLKKELEDQGVIFTDTDTAVREHPELVRKYFATVVPTGDNKFAALNTAVWSGGSFIYVPPGVQVDIPLQAYFRINTENMGQFERTLIIADEGSFVHYVEGCTAPIYATDSLHGAVVELIALKGSRIRYTTIQNWSNNVYNLVTKRAVAHENATVEWVDANIGSKVTMKYPAVFMTGRGARADILSIAFAGSGQHQDAGAKVVHVAPDSTSKIVSKSISKDGGQTTYRGLVKIHKGATNAASRVECDALMFGADSRSDTYPYIEVAEKRGVTVEHEASVSKVGEEQLFYLKSRGLNTDEAMALVVNGFIEPFTKELPMEYAVEMNRLIQLEMEGSVG